MKQIISLILVLFTGGCFNLATAPSQISGAYVSDVKYNHYSCDELAVELSSLARRENQLVTAQEQRRSSSQMQAFWLGYGHGDTGSKLRNRPMCVENKKPYAGPWRKNNAETSIQYVGRADILGRSPGMYSEISKP